MPETDHPKILVVNDDPPSLLALTSLLLDWAYENSCEIITARSGEEALRNVLTHEFAVILLDVNMPGMDGFETAEAIHSRPRSAAIPIIFVTAFLTDEIKRLKAYEQGAVDYLFTPIIPQILQAKVSIFVALAKQNLELKKQSEELNRRALKLAEANTQLKIEVKERKLAVQQNRTKDEFLAMLGHELRNPLNAISNASTLLGLPGVNETIAIRAKTIIQRQIQHLTNIIEDLLDLSRVTSGKILLSKQPIELSALVNHCLETLQTSGRLQPYSLKTEMENIWIEADPTRLEQIVINLFDNALKYTPAGGKININLHAEVDSAVLEISDSGVGISAELLPHIFDIFVQGERSIDRSQGGLGIGLALVRQLVDLHDGTIAAESAGSTHGSKFTVRLPKLKNVQKTPPLSAGNHEIKTYNILLIEDNDDGRETLSNMLIALGHTVYSAAGGSEGLRLMTIHKPEIALIDIGLPDIDGYEVARLIRTDSNLYTTPLIALTGYGLKEDRERAIEVGFNLHLAKPIGLEQLLDAIAQCLK